MLIPIIMLLAVFCMSNAKRAQLKGLNPVLWVSLTIISFLLGMFTTCFMLAVMIMAKNPALLTLAQNNDREGLNKFMLANLGQHEMLYFSLLFAGGVGGYLLIRYLIEKKPIKE